MSFFKKLFNFYINASIHVAFAVVAFLLITQQYLNILEQYNLSFFVFFSTLFGYNFVKYVGLAKQHYIALTTRLKGIFMLSLCSGFAAIYFFIYLQFYTKIAIILFGVLTLFYALPLLSGFAKSLRQISYLKVVVVALVWAGVTVLLPVLEVTKTINNTIIVLFLQRFFLVIVLILPFDIRDMHFDDIALYTIPKKIGVLKTKYFGLILILLAFLLELALQNSAKHKAIFLAIIFLIAVLLMRANKQQQKYYSAFFVEAIPIVWWGLLLVF